MTYLWKVSSFTQMLSVFIPKTLLFSHLDLLELFIEILGSPEEFKKKTKKQKLEIFSKVESLVETESN